MRFKRRPDNIGIGATYIIDGWRGVVPVLSGLRSGRQAFEITFENGRFVSSAELALDSTASPARQVLGTDTNRRRKPERRLVAVKELSLYLSMPVASIYTYVHSGKIPRRCIVRLSRALRFDLAEIDKWIEAERRGRSA